MSQLVNESARKQIAKLRLFKNFLIDSLTNYLN